MLPNFVCPGAPKSGTTTVFQLLKQHPEIYLPRVKEPKFFSEHQNYSKGLDWYQTEFYPDAQGKKIIGDMSPDYMIYHYVPERIRQCLGENVRLVFMLRNPVDRAYSHYLMNRWWSGEHRPFEKAVHDNIESIRREGPWNKPDNYVCGSLYYLQIINFLNYFPKENMKFILFEDYIKDTIKIVNEIICFLGLQSDREMEFKMKINRARFPRSMIVSRVIGSLAFKNTISAILGSDKMTRKCLRYLHQLNTSRKKNQYPAVPDHVRNKLRDYFAGDLVKLEELIGKDIGLWLR